MFKLHDPPYDSVDFHDFMLSDAIRTHTYKDSMEQIINPGDSVLDFGAGTGIFSLIAANCGAKVYSVERSSIINTAMKIAKDNSLENRITFIHKDAKDIQIPQKVDHLVSEWMGVFALQENMLPDLLRLRDKYLKPEGNLIPEKIDLYISMVNAPQTYQEVGGKWNSWWYGLDFSQFKKQQLSREHINTFRASDVISYPEILASIDLYEVSTTKATNLNQDLRLTPNSSSLCQGLAGWFKAYFPDRNVLDTSPYSPETAWQQAYFPNEPFEITDKKEYTVHFSSHPETSQFVHFKWEIK